jgi:TetR/AcrR family transcriptional repressor of nem operon
VNENAAMAPAPRSGEAADTATRILDVAERLAQTRGFNGFSYADISSELEISKASLHYHFPSKADLGQALIERYATHFAEALATIEERERDPIAKLDAYAGIYADVLQDQRMCLCGMLAADYDTLPKPMGDAVIRFFDENEAWLARVLEQGANADTLHLSRSPREEAQAILSGLEGAMLVARPYGDLSRFQAVANALLASLTSPSPPERGSGSGA